MQQNPTGRNLTLSVGTVLDTADYNNFVNQTQYGLIPVATETGYAVAFPLSVNTINIPLPGEPVILFTGPEYYNTDPSGGGSVSPGQTYYYISAISVLGNINHNVRPMPRATTTGRSNDSAVRNSVNLDKGIGIFSSPNAQYDNPDVHAGNEESIDSIQRARRNQIDPRRLISFIEKEVKPLQSFQGDHLFQSRFGNAIRLSSTHTINNQSTKEYVKYPYWKGESTNDPFIAITCGINDNDPDTKFSIENPDLDDSTIMLSSNQRIQNMTLSQPKRLRGFAPLTDYRSPQIVLTSDRLIFNSKQDEILLSGGKTVGIATPGWAMDMDKMFDILEGMLTELAALTSAQATFVTGVGPTGPATNATKIQDLLSSLRNMRQ